MKTIYEVTVAYPMPPLEMQAKYRLLNTAEVEMLRSYQDELGFKIISERRVEAYTASEALDRIRTEMSASSIGVNGVDATKPKTLADRTRLAPGLRE